MAVGPVRGIVSRPMTQARLSRALGFLALITACGKAPNSARKAMSSGSGAPGSSLAAGGFGLPQSVDATYVRLIDALDAAFVAWASTPAVGELSGPNAT